MNIVQLNVENFKRLVAVEIAPGADGSLVLVTGRNAAGKTSVLDSIESVLRGAKADPEVPIRRGASRATVKIDLGDLIATRTWTKDGTKLTVQSKDGALYPTPQAVLDRLAGKIALDPLAFSRMEPAKQLETLRGIVGLDFTELDQQRAAAYFNRTETNREQRTAQAWADAAQRYPDAPPTEVSIAGLQAEWQRRQDVNATRAKRSAEIVGWKSEIDRAKAGIKDALDSSATAGQSLDEQLASIDKRLEEDIATAQRIAFERRQRAKADADRALSAANHRNVTWAASLDAAEEECAKLTGSIPDHVDATDIAHQIEIVEITNQKVRQNAKAADLDAKAKALANKSAALTARIDAIEAEKREKLAAAKFPIPDLSFDEHGVTFRGVPFAQASSAEQLRASVAIGLAMNPKLRVLLVRDGSLLDADGMATLAKIAEDQHAQIWLEKVADGAPVGIVIEDGMVRAKVPENGGR